MMYTPVAIAPVGPTNVGTTYVTGALAPLEEPFGGDQFQIAVRTALLGALLGAFGSIASGSEGRGILKGVFIGFGVGGLAGFTLEPIVEHHVQEKLRHAIQDSPLFGALGRASS